MPTWLSGLQYLPVTFTAPRAPMRTPILGVVLHTTNHGPGERTLESFRDSWQSEQRQGAHFMVDRAGHVAQFRALQDGIGHIGGEMTTRYYGIEHIAHWKEPLTDAQKESSAQLVEQLAQLLGYPIAAVQKAGDSGVGFHKQFDSTGCGEEVFCKPGWVAPRAAIDRSLKAFEEIVDRAQEIQLQRKPPPHRPAAVQRGEKRRP